MPTVEVSFPAPDVLEHLPAQVQAIQDLVARLTQIADIHQQRAAVEIFALELPASLLVEDQAELGAYFGNLLEHFSLPSLILEDVFLEGVGLPADFRVEDSDITDVFPEWFTQAAIFSPESFTQRSSHSDDPAANNAQDLSMDLDDLTTSFRDAASYLRQLAANVSEALGIPLANNPDVVVAAPAGASSNATVRAMIAQMLADEQSIISIEGTLFTCTNIDVDMWTTCLMYERARARCTPMHGLTDARTLSARTNMTIPSHTSVPMHVARPHNDPDCPICGDDFAGKPVQAVTFRCCNRGFDVGCLLQAMFMNIKDGKPIGCPMCRCERYTQADVVEFMKIHLAELSCL